ncbi:hypothetical protein [Chengkuizengella axinellae]|uniref:Uncharacterized protein n=1 Tax=Chengkuizengella axinellae TaxID=3064388 RepID=A0ABT9IUT1_9BACL|nr:hypothetical protein [Chengkuizengella sp. 2205SS18-9]MDP5273072.1 hypothetical protein [Chengkuizengella sp. 2205SS18-9]
MTEKSILAYFNSPEEAEGAATKLRTLRASELSIERFSKYQGDGVTKISNPLTGSIPSLGKLTLKADFSAPDVGILAASDVSASGMSDGGQGKPTGKDILLTVVIDMEQYQQAIQVIEASGGMV